MLEEFPEYPYILITTQDGQTQTRGQEKSFVGNQLNPKDTPQEAEGVFATWHFSDNTLHICTDRYGAQPFYYYQKDNIFALSTSIPQLLKCPEINPEIDDAAMAVFLRMGFFLSDDTPFRYIKAIAPNADWSIHNGKITRKRGGYRFETVSSLNVEETKTAFINLFRQAIEKRPPKEDNLIVPLSGGRDSRHIYLELLHQGYQPKAITHQPMPNRSDEDVRLSAIVAKMAGMEHIIIEQEKSPLAAEMQKNLLTNFCSDEHTQILGLANYLQDKTNTIYDGVAGGLSESRGFFTEKNIALFKEQNTPKIVDHFLNLWNRGITEETLKQALNPDIYARFSRDFAVLKLGEEVKKHYKAGNPLSSFLYYNRTRREISLIPHALYQQIQTIHSPFLDYNVLPFLLSLNLGMLCDSNNRSLHEEVVHQAYPKYSNIPFDAELQPRTTTQTQALTKFPKEFAIFGLKNILKNNPYLNKTYLLPRLLKGILIPNYLWHGFVQIIYLAQIHNTLQSLKKS